MKYLALIWSEGRATPAELAVMHREIPRYVEEMDRRGVRLLGRELDLPETGVTIWERDGETLVSDGPFAETKEFVAGFNLLECADLDEAIEVAAKCPVSWFKTLELRAFPDGAGPSEEVAAFGRGEDGAARPYLLATWTEGTPAPAGEAWRQDLRERGHHILGSALGNTATTVRVRDGETQVSHEPATGAKAFITGFDVVRCAERQQAIQLATAHPAAGHHPIEVRPFYAG
jgi:hypothetical protein